MNRLFFFVLCMLLSTSLWAQDEHEAARKYANTISANDFKAHISFLADDLLEGRETGERGQVMAAHYIRTHFMRLGLEPGNEGSFYQEFAIRRTKAQKGEMRIGNKSYTHGDAFFSTKLPKDIDGDWVFAGYGKHDEGYDNYINLDVSGKNTLIFGGTPDSPNEISREIIADWNDRTKVAKSKGVKNLWIIVPDEWVSRLRRFAGGQASYNSEGEENPMSILYMSASMATDLLAKAKTNAEKLQAALAKSEKSPTLKFKKLNLSYNASADEEVFVPTNVLGFLEGTDKKDEVIIITGHYDHVGINRRGEVNNGADDDASGTTGVLEVAEAFALAAQNGHRPRRSILFMTVSGEEKGLLGSAYYADNPIYPVENTVANLNMDMIGRIDPTYEKRADSANYIYLIGADKLSTDLHEVSEWANKTFTQLTLDYKYNDDNDPNRFYYRSDHYNFAKKGIPIIFYFNGTHADYHRPTDDIEKIHFEKAAKIARLAFHTTWEIANREERIKVDKEVR